MGRNARIDNAYEGMKRGAKCVLYVKVESWMVACTIIGTDCSANEKIRLEEIPIL